MKPGRRCPAPSPRRSVEFPADPRSPGATTRGETRRSGNACGSPALWTLVRLPKPAGLAPGARAPVSRDPGADRARRGPGLGRRLALGAPLRGRRLHAVDAAARRRHRRAHLPHPHRNQCPPAAAPRSTAGGRGRRHGGRALRRSPGARRGRGLSAGGVRGVRHPAARARRPHGRGRAAAPPPAPGRARDEPGAPLPLPRGRAPPASGAGRAAPLDGGLLGARGASRRAARGCLHRNRKRGPVDPPLPERARGAWRGPRSSRDRRRPGLAAGRARSRAALARGGAPLPVPDQSLCPLVRGGRDGGGAGRELPDRPRRTGGAGRDARAGAGGDPGLPSGAARDALLRLDPAAGPAGRLERRARRADGAGGDARVP